MRIKLLFFLMFSILCGCTTTNCSTNPNELSRLCAASYKVGMNKKLEQHLEQKRVEADDMKKQVAIYKESLLESKEQLSKASLKLAAVDAKTGGANKEARRIAAELKLKQLDLQNRVEDLSEIEQRIIRLKGEKSNKEQTVAQLNQAERDLIQTREEIKILNDYLKNDLLIRAENALAYD